MAGGSFVTDEVNQRIAYLSTHTDWKYERIMVELGPNAPSLSYIQKKGAEAKKINKEYQDKETQWNMGTLNNFPIPSEAIAFILRVQNSGGHFGKFTIRQALWVARLYQVIQDVALVNDLSWHYALREKICQLSKTPFDTTHYDCLLRSPDKLKEKFESEYPDTLESFELQKAAFESLTGYKLNEASCEIVFKGNEAWAKRNYQPNVFIGHRKDVIESLKKTKYWDKSIHIPDGDFSLKLPIPIIKRKSKKEGE
jgi:hypothetical protein